MAGLLGAATEPGQSLRRLLESREMVLAPGQPASGDSSPPRGRWPGSGEPRAELYTLHISGMPSANIQGRMPKPLGALVRFLSGLMLAHCC